MHNLKTRGPLYPDGYSGNFNDQSVDVNNRRGEAYMVKKRAGKTLSGKWPRDWSVGVRVWVERQGQIVIDEAVADVLLALDRAKSISGAARSLGISYRHAWLLIQAANENSAQQMTTTAVGGQRGGGAQLTDYGRAAVAVFQKIQQQIRDAAAKSLPRLVSSGTRETSIVHLAAAISLQEVIGELLREYALVRPTLSVRTIFGASNELAEQVAIGGSIDVFIAANSKHISRLAKVGLIDPASRCKLASNGLAIVGDKSFTGKLRKPSDLRRIGGDEIIVADPACPLGACTAGFLKAAKLMKELEPRLHSVENSRAVVTAMRTPGSRIGIIFGSDVANAVGVTPLLQIPLSHAMTVYEGAAIATSRTPGEAQELLTFLRSTNAKKCFRRCGFSV